MKGKVDVSGSKNAVLPILAATLITDERCTVRNVPDLGDISTMISMLEILGKKVNRENSCVVIEPFKDLKGEAPYDLVKKLRASILVMGALAGRKNKIRVALPGGCAIGTRPIDLHLKGLRKMGAEISVSGGFVNLRSRGLAGATIYLDYPSVGATENLVMAACHAKGRSIIENTAREPEVMQLVDFLKEMGVRIEVSGNTLTVYESGKLKPVDFTVMDDRIQAGTYLVAGGINGSQVEIGFKDSWSLEAVIEKMIECGADIRTDTGGIYIKGPDALKSTEVRTSPYPGFPTDLQAPFISLLATASGVSVITEEIFESRYLHCAELMRMGAEIEIKGHSAIVTGVRGLSGAPVTAQDLRGGASLILAGLAAEGRTEVSGVYHIERGYENIVENLRNLGANIWEE